jgi:hypothetical protein
MPPALGDVFRVISQMQQRVERRIGDNPDVATASTLTARWSTAGNKLLPTKCRYAITAPATLDTNFRPINKHSLNIKSKATPYAGVFVRGAGVA